jgi:quercetin dioxygenase-like cupin family protein
VMKSKQLAVTIALAGLLTVAASDSRRVAADAQAPAAHAQVTAAHAHVLQQRFDGDLVVGKRTLHVTVADWIVPNGPGMDVIRFDGYAVVQELAGKMRAELNGKQFVVREGDVVSVPASAALMARAARSTAIFTATVVTNRPRPAHT